MKILFQGDSITDMGRDYSDPHDMGPGYAGYVKKILSSQVGFSDIEYINLGISGNRTCDLVKRWQRDCIEIQPDLVSILIGINDTWRKYDSNDPVSAEQFETNYRTILEDTKKNTNAKIIILEPFLVPADKEKEKFRDDLYIKTEVVRKLAREYADAYIPLDGLFAAGCVAHEPSFYAEDGIHPSPEGARYIAGFYVREAVRLLRS